MAVFPPAFLDEIRTRVPVSGVVGRRVKLIRKGREFHGLCPFHNEKTPSFTVNEDKGFFHCFGCGAHGDVIGFEMRAGHLSFPEAVEKLAGEAGLAIPTASPEERRREIQRAGLHDATEAACQFFEAQLRAPSGREGLAYLRNRGLAEDTITRFRLGWAPDSREALKKAVMSAEIPESLLIEAGLLKKPEGGGASFDLFRGRVMFPITDRRGRVIAFGARALGDGMPKYLNSPETPLFHKGSTLYGLAHAREGARTKGSVVAAEGYMDVIALHQAGFDHAVAPLGTALTEEQITQLWRLADEPVLCFDGDSAGQRAMGRAAERALPILTAGKSLRFATIPGKDDPDSLIKARGAAAMQAVLDGARPLVEVVWAMSLEGKPLDTPERRAALESELKEKAFSIADETVRWQYWNSFREKMREAFRPRRAPFVPGQKKSAVLGPLRGADGRVAGIPRPSPPIPARIRQERQLLALLIRHPPLLDAVGERLGETRFSDSALDKLRRGILSHLDGARGLDEESLCAHLRSDGLAGALEALLVSDEAASARRHEDARTLWEHTFVRYTHSDIQAETEDATQILANDMSDANFQRLSAVVSLGTRGTEFEDDDR